MEIIGFVSFIIVATVYVSIAVFSLYMTFQEQRSLGTGVSLYTIGAYLLCLAWPLPVLAVLLTIQLRSDQKQSS